jgi:hypothetical protein
LYFDLIGLPPTPQRMEQFLADADPKAYETLVEALLSNAHHGERMAIGWLDMVRFADTIGYHSDNPRNVWPYRDWVIKSFNDNKRFDNPRAIAVDATGKRFVLLAFEHCQRAWGNAPCPCLHSDPAFGEISPGETKTLRGYIGFGEDAKVLEEEASQVLGKAKP